MIRSHVSPVEPTSLYAQWMQVANNTDSPESDTDFFAQDLSKDCIITDHTTIAIPRNIEVRMRHLVVFGKLAIVGSPSSTLLCKHICVFGGTLTVRNVNCFVEAIIPATKDQFEKALPHLEKIAQRLAETGEKPFYMKLPSDFSVTNDVDQLGPLEITGLMASARNADPALLELFLHLGANVKKCNGNQQSALHIAAQYNQLLNVKLLLAANAMVDAEDYLGTTPLLMAAMYTNLSAMQALISGKANIHAKDLMGQTVIRAAVDSSDREMINYVVSCGAPLHDVNPLTSKSMAPVVMHAVVNGNETYLKELFAGGLKPDLMNSRRDTGLILAGKYDQKEVAALFLNNKAEIEAISSEGSALTWAVRGGFSALAQFLLDRGASLEGGIFQDLIATALRFKQVEIIPILTQAAPAKARELLIQAAERDAPETVSCLLRAAVSPNENGASKRAFTKADVIAAGQEWLLWFFHQGNTEAAVLLIRLGVVLESTCEDKMALLEYFIFSGDLEGIKELLEKGEVEVLPTTPNNLLSPLMCARLALAEVSQRESCVVEKYETIVDLFSPKHSPPIATPSSAPRRKKSVSWELPA